MGRGNLRAVVRAALLSAAADLAASRPELSESAWLDAARRQALERLLASGRYTAADGGALYEELQAVALVRRPGGLTVRRSREHRARGIYYTHPALVEYLLERTLVPMLAAVPRPRICDPACGSGAFLIAAAARLIASGLTPEAAAACLCGCDTDAEALALCRGALRAAGAALLIEADGLLADLPGGFDLVVGNPPYIASGLRGAAAAEAGRAAQMRARYPQAAAYKLNTYPLFLQRGIELLRPGGLLAFVVPDSLLLGKYFAGIRRHILETCCIEELTLIRDDFWAHGRVGQTLLVVLRREPEERLRAAQQVRVRLVRTPAELPKGGYSHVLRQASFAADPLARFRLVFSPADARFLAAIEDSPDVRPLGTFLRLYSGLIGRAGQRTLLRSSYPDGRVRVEKGGRVLYDGLPPAAAWRPLLRSGAEIDRHSVRWRGESVLVEPALLKSGGKRELYEQPKLLLRQTADRLICAYDDSGLFCLNNLHLLVPRLAEVQPHLLYFAALLNSTVLNRYWRLVTLEEGRLYPQIDLDMLALLPVPAPQSNASASAELAAIARALHRLPLTAENRPSLLAQADALAAELYGLTGGDVES